MATPPHSTIDSERRLPPSEHDALLVRRNADVHTLPRHIFWMVEAVLVANVFLAGFDGTVMASTYAVITSEFHGAQLASWLSTSYLVTTTALQPLYGRVSDLLGRRVCLMAATALFGLGCLGCGLSPDLGWLIVMRGLAGAGGGGLMTMATILHTDLVPPTHRGLYQALQNIMHGLGSVLGASLGGVLAGALGWRSCFLLQVPVCAAALVVTASAVPSWDREGKMAEGDLPGEFLEEDEETGSACHPLFLSPSPSSSSSLWSQIDFSGACLLITGLSTMLVALTLLSNRSSSGNDLLLILSLSVTTVVLLAAFVAVEARTTAIPLLPLAMLHGSRRVALLILNATLGLSGYGFLFLMPLFFQAVLLDTASTAGLRLVGASAATPIGGLATGLAMRWWSCGDSGNVVHRMLRLGSVILLLGSFLNLAMRMYSPEHPPSTWKYSAYLVTGGFGQGMSYPASLFSFLGACEPEEHAVATYLVYLVRSVGSVAGVAAIAMVIQTVLTRELTEAFRGKEGGQELIDTLTHSVEALRDLPPDTRLLVQGMYYDACRAGMYFLLAMGIMTVLCSWIATRKR